MLEKFGKKNMVGWLCPTGFTTYYKMSANNSVMTAKTSSGLIICQYSFLFTWKGRFSGRSERQRTQYSRNRVGGVRLAQTREQPTHHFNKPREFG